jgi:hypothetical protein
MNNISKYQQYKNNICKQYIPIIFENFLIDTNTEHINTNNNSSLSVYYN